MHMSTQFEVELGDDFAQCIAAANDVVPTIVMAYIVMAYGSAQCIAAANDVVPTMHT